MSEKASILDQANTWFHWEGWKQSDNQPKLLGELAIAAVLLEPGRLTSDSVARVGSVKAFYELQLKAGFNRNVWVVEYASDDDSLHRGPVALDHLEMQVDKLEKKILEKEGRRIYDPWKRFDFQMLKRAWYLRTGRRWGETIED